MKKIKLTFLNFFFFLTFANFLMAAAVVPVEGGSAEEKASGQTWLTAPNDKLPNVLIIGDSISIGYTLFVKEQLKDTANVYRPYDAKAKKPINCGDTARGLSQLDLWLGDTSWRVIHFNFGLHDLKWLDEKGNYVSPDKGKQVAPPELYEKNLRELVKRLKETGAVLIWGSTTSVPDNSPGRIKGDDAIYNAVAEKVMKDNNVLIDDFGSALGDKLGELQKPNNVHFTDEGSKVLATSVTEKVKLALTQPWTPVVRKKPVPPTSFQLKEPQQISVEKPVTYHSIPVTLPQPMVLKLGMTLEVQAEIKTANIPKYFSLQILSVDGKMSSLTLPPWASQKAIKDTYTIKSLPGIHPAARNKDAWVEGDLIERVNILFALATPDTGTVDLKSLNIKTP